MTTDGERLAGIEKELKMLRELLEQRIDGLEKEQRRLFCDHSVLTQRMWALFLALLTVTGGGVVAFLVGR